MKARLGEHLRTQFVGYIALFLALGTGTAFALNVDSKDVENNSIKSKDLKNGKAVKCEDVVPGEPICQPAGGGGAEVVGGGGDGVGGDGVGLTNTTVRSNTVTLSQTCFDDGFGGRACSAAPQPVTASCNPGERATGGGYQGMEETFRSSDVADDPPADRPEPASGTPTGWTVRAEGFARNGGGPIDPPAPTFTVYVVCAS
jgi:hypothetical protein